jgi:hypothetical protein
VTDITAEEAAALNAARHALEAIWHRNRGRTLQGAADSASLILFAILNRCGADIEPVRHLD